MRVLGVDFGSSSIGLAVGESEFGVATPRPAVKPTGTLRLDAAALQDIAEREQCEAAVVGLPLGPAGEPTKMSRVAGQLIEAMRALGMSVSGVNEAGSTQEAEKNLERAGYRMSATKRHRDSEAACVILRRFFEQGADA